MTLTNITTDVAHAKGLFASAANWATLRDRATCDLVYDLYLMSLVSDIPPYDIRRSVMNFDLTSIAPTETVDSVILKIYCLMGGYIDPVPPAGYSYQSVQGSNVSDPIFDGDFSRTLFSATKYSQVDYILLLWNTYVDFAFNADGIAKVQAGLGADHCGFVVREGHDFDNVPPNSGGPDWGKWDNGTAGFAPILAVTHHSGGLPTFGGGVNRRNRPSKRF